MGFVEGLQECGALWAACCWGPGSTTGHRVAAVALAVDGLGAGKRCRGSGTYWLPERGSECDGCGKGATAHLATCGPVTAWGPGPAKHAVPGGHCVHCGATAGGPAWFSAQTCLPAEGQGLWPVHAGKTPGAQQACSTQGQTWAARPRVTHWAPAPT